MPSTTTILSFDMGYKNLAYCYVEGTRILRWECVNVVEGKTRAKKPSIALVTEALVDHLQTLDMTPDKVLIETQPAGGAGRRSNTMMKVLSHVVQAFFYARGVKKVQFVSPKRKLKGCRDVKGLKTKDRYAIHKQYGIDQCLERLKTMEAAAEWTDFFTKQTKKDDLADSLLQAFV